MYRSALNINIKIYIKFAKQNKESSVINFTCQTELAYNISAAKAWVNKSNELCFPYNIVDICTQTHQVFTCGIIPAFKSTEHY